MSTAAAATATKDPRFDAEIPVSPLLEMRAAAAKKMRERRRGKEDVEEEERER